MSSTIDLPAIRERARRLRRRVESNKENNPMDCMFEKRPPVPPVPVVEVVP